MRNLFVGGSIIISQVLVMSIFLSVSGCSKPVPNRGVSGNPSSSPSNTDPGSSTTVAKKAAPEIIVPEENPYYSTSQIKIKGSCGPRNSIKVDRDGSETEIFCDDQGAFFFTENRINTDGSYVFHITQSDPKEANSRSAPVSVRWIRTNAVPLPPVIKHPSTAIPYVSAKQISISGTCSNGHQVHVLLVNNRTTPCIGGRFSITLDKDANHLNDATTSDYEVAQESPSGVWSKVVGGQWRIDSSTFSAHFVQIPPAIYVVPGDVSESGESDVKFRFGANYPNSSFRCKLDQESFVDCPEVYILKNLPSGKHKLTIKAVNSNADTGESQPIAYSWVNEAYPTVALYHLNGQGSDYLLDSSPYSNKNNLIDTGTTQAGSMAGFSDARRFQAHTYLSVTAPNSNFDLLNSKMTITAFVYMSLLPSSSYPKYVIASKMGSTGNYGWEFGFKWISSGVFRLYFLGSQNGTTLTEVQSSNLPQDNIAALSRFMNHVAVTFSAADGSVQFYFGGKNRGSAKFQAPTPLFASSKEAKFRIGGTATDGQEFRGLIDEVELSRVVRFTQEFIVPEGESNGSGSNPGSSNQKVLGNIEKIGVTGSQYDVFGWACDYGMDRSISVQLYAGGPAGTGQLVKSWPANSPAVSTTDRDAIFSSCGGSAATAHRFQIPLTNEEIQKFAGKAIYVHGISTTGNAQANLLLNNGGKYAFPIPWITGSSVPPLEIKLWNSEDVNTGWGSPTSKLVTLPTSLLQYDTLQVRMKLVCANNDCSKDPWDFLAKLFVSEHSYEIARWVTPYGTPGEWTTDISPMLGLRALSDGGSTTFAFWCPQRYTLSISLLFSNTKKGRRAVYVKPLFNGGALNKDYNSNHKAISFSVPATNRASIYSIFSGHGWGNTKENCAEFCDTTHEYNINGKAYSHSSFISNCYGVGVLNQYGNYTYGRNGWCPGADVKPYEVDISNALIRVAPNVNELKYRELYQGHDYIPTPSPNPNPGGVSPWIELQSYLVVY